MRAPDYMPIRKALEMLMDYHCSCRVSNQNANTVSAFSIKTASGMLTPLAGSPFAVGSVPHGIAVDEAGKFLFVGNQNDVQPESPLCLPNNLHSIASNADRDPP